MLFGLTFCVCGALSSLSSRLCKPLSLQSRMESFRTGTSVVGVRVEAAPFGFVRAAQPGHLGHWSSNALRAGWIMALQQPHLHRRYLERVGAPGQRA